MAASTVLLCLVVQCNVDLQEMKTLLHFALPSKHMTSVKPACLVQSNKHQLFHIEHFMLGNICGFYNVTPPDGAVVPLRFTVLILGYG